MGTLYIVGTPIGNLGDFSPRGVETLRSVDSIAAEDTRVTRKLLTHFSIDTPMISYHEHNKNTAGERILLQLQQGQDIALVSDAGMPAISDPGEQLVRQAAEHQIPVVVIPGPSAVISALAISGLPTQRFSFEGFLDTNSTKRREHLQSLQNDTRTLTFYEAPHRLISTLEELYQVLGDRRISLCREMTKLYEEVHRTTLSEAILFYKEHSPRGEFVLVLEGASLAAEDTVSFEAAVAMVLQRESEGLSLSQAAREVADTTPHRRGKLYRGALDAREPQK